MSRIYFHSQNDDDAELRGSERAYAGILCDDLFRASLGISPYSSETDPIFSLIPQIDLSIGPDKALRLWCSSILDKSFVLPDGQKVPVFDVALNTALVIGSDPIKLLARLHAQCEIHAYVEGPNREWLADIIHDGRKSSILRPNMGWEAVEELLRLRNDEPVVTSYSVTERFPNRFVSSFILNDDSDDDPDDQWYALPDADRWELGLERLRQNHWLELRPNFWCGYYFSDAHTGFRLMEIAEKGNT